MDKLFLELENKWMTAWKNKDENTAREILADEFTLASSLSSDLVDKEAWIEKAMTNYNCESFEIKNMKVREYGNTAVLNILFYQTATANNHNWSGNFALTDVWVNKNGKWQVVARHASWLK